MKSNAPDQPDGSGLSSHGPVWTARFRGALATLSLLGLVAVLTAATVAHHADLASASNSTEDNIAKLTANLLEHSQFTHHPLDAELAGKFLDRYLDALDASHMIFLQSDLEEFAPYRAELATLTRRDGDTTPAHVIFHRYLKRLGEEVSYLTNQLQTATFDFTGPDTFQTDRESAPRPLDLAAAQALWQERLRYDYLQEKLNGKTPAEIVQTLTRRYTRLWQMMNKLSNEQVLGVYLDALAHVYDPHSDYLGHEEMDSFSIAMNLSLSGIGATLQSQDGYCSIRSLVPGGPAARSHQLKPNDRIVAVAQQGQPPVDIIDLPLSQAVELIRGPKGTEVTLTLIPADAPDDAARKTMTLVRDEIQLEDQRAKARVIDWPDGNQGTVRLGVIDLPSFYGDLVGNGDQERVSATKDVALLLRKLQTLNVQGVVLDLRQNGGGSLPEAISLTGLFIRRGPIVQKRDAAGRVEVEDDPDSSVVYDGPLIVLTSRFTASASEILAGALQDYGRALIVGDSSTFGKGTVQSLIPLQRLMDHNGLAYAYDPGALKVTISEFYRPGGASTQLKGVTPDLVLPSSSDNPKFAEAALNNPLPWGHVPPARHAELDRVQPYLRTLQARSAARVAGDVDFAYLKADLAEVERRQAATDVSLNESIRRAEREKSQAEQKAWEKKLAAVPRPSVKEHEITVEMANQPGLPPPVTKSLAQETPALGEPSAPGHPPNPAALLGDPVLRETEHILADYVELAGRGATLTQARALSPASSEAPAP